MRPAQMAMVKAIIVHVRSGRDASPIRHAEYGRRRRNGLAIEQIERTGRLDLHDAPERFAAHNAHPSKKVITGLAKRSRPTLKLLRLSCGQTVTAPETPQILACTRTISAFFTHPFSTSAAPRR
ncbi:MAG: hypothetical protein MUE84_06685 [Hyphomonas sp.]|nr:hypothetical protein [Hyphomonas sp.]